MYRKSGDSWLKHLDFIVLDLVALQLAYISSYALRMGAGNLYKNSLYLNIGIIIALTDICTAFFTEPYRGIMRRGYFVKACIFCECACDYVFVHEQTGR